MENLEEIREEIRKSMLEDLRFEEQMRTDIEFFCEWTVENLYIKPERTSGLFLFDIIDELQAHCNKYDQSFKELCNYIGDK